MSGITIYKPEWQQFETVTSSRYNVPYGLLELEIMIYQTRKLDSYDWVILGSDNI
jgi:hypothetical protein